MKHENYLQGVLTVIAAALVAIAVRMWLPAPPAPTVGDIGEVMAITDQSQREAATRDLYNRLPFVAVRIEGTAAVAVEGPVELEEPVILK